MMRVRRAAEKVLVAGVLFYRKVVSPFLPPSCRYHPSCSEYMIIAIRENGPVWGLFQGALRVLRCNPLFPGGVDFPRKKEKVRSW